ncbi:MAG: DUF6502 family protein [Steroidobacteraceae bacterium]
MTTPKNLLLQSCLRLLRPLARIMLRHGLSTYDFSRIADVAFIQAAQDILCQQGKTPSFSRVSTITGLHRHVVSNIVKSAGAKKPGLATDKDYQRNRLARVLSGWFESPDYPDQDGRPRVLPIDGPEPSFASLVRSFSGDIYPKIILDELLRVGAIRVQKDGAVRALARRYTLGGADAAALQQLGTAARDLFCTLEHNLAAPAENRLFDDSVVTVRLSSAAIPLLRQMLHRRGESFLEDVEGWLTERETPDTSTMVRAGVMVQLFVDPEPGSVEKSGDLKDD